MPKHRTHFREEWLKAKDSNSHDIGFWCEKKTYCDVYCRFCKKSVRFDNRGLSQLINHSETKTHVQLVKDVGDGKQLVFFNQSMPGSSGNGPSSSSSRMDCNANEVVKSLPVSLACLSSKNDSLKAELLWAMKVVSGNLPYNSANDLNELFRTMFPDSKIACEFSMRPQKLSYLITEAVGPYFHEALLYDVRKSSSPYTISFDELTNKENKKQLDLIIKYWSVEKNEVATHHLQTYLMSHCKATDITEKIYKSIDDCHLLLENLLTLGCDGPNVNKTVFSTISEKKKSLGLPQLLNVGTCNLHKVHGAFGSAVKEFGTEVVDLVIDVKNFFKLSPVRSEELKNLQEKLGYKTSKFLKHVDCRWLSLAPALERIKSQWEVMKEYFFIELPKRDKTLSQIARYQRIVKTMKAAPTMFQLNFLLNISTSLQPFLTFFQREEPLIHLLYDHMMQMVRNLYSRFLKIDVMKKKSIDQLQDIKFPSVENEVRDCDLEIGVETRKELVKLLPNQQKEQLVLVRMFIRQLAITLTKKLPFHNVIIREAACLKPENLCKQWTIESLKKLSKELHIFPPINVDVVVDEWRTLQCEDIPKDWYIFEAENKIVHKRIDSYYGKIFDLKDALGNNKYPELTKVVKSILVVPHGNSDVERGFSQTSNFLTDSRINLSESSINAIQTIKDGLKKFDNCCHKVPLTTDLIKKGMVAHKAYLSRLEEEKRLEIESKEKGRLKKEAEDKELEKKEQQKKDFEEKTRQSKETILKEKTLEKKEAETKHEINVYEGMVHEANDRIKNSIKIKDMKGVQIGQTMLEAACLKVNESRGSLEKIRNEQKEVEKTKRTMLDYFCKPKKLKK